MQPRQATAQHSEQRDQTTARASWRRKNHANIESGINLIVSRIAAETGEEMPPKCRLLLSAILGAHGGGEVIGEETERSYLALADQLQFTGTDDARRSRVRAWLNAFEDWQRKTFLLVAVLRGGELLGYDGDRPIFSASKFVDLVRPVADEMVMRARASAQWRTNPGLALAAQAEWGVRQLSRHAEYVEPAEVEDDATGDDPAEVEELSAAEAADLVDAEIARRLKKLREYGEGREARIVKDVERIGLAFGEGDLLVESEIDARLAALDVHEAHIKAEVAKHFTATRQYLNKQRKSRLTRIMDAANRSASEDAEDAAAPPPDARASLRSRPALSGYYIQGKDSELPEGFVEEVIGEGGGKENHTPPPDETRENIDDSAPDLCERALEIAADGRPVLAVWGVADGICDCPKGSECRSAGKHPHGKLSPRGVHSATTDPAAIRAMFAADPPINFGEAMGGPLNLVAVDIDPRNGGDLSLYDLTEAHGADAFPATREKTTAGGGWHKLYFLRSALTSAKGEIKGKLAPGIDIKGAGGYIVGPSCAHVSGLRYGDYNGSEIAFAPEWMECELRKMAAGEAPAKVVDFQAHRERSPRVGGARTFGVGERNDGLRDVALGRWLHAADWGIESEQDLLDQMREVRDTRCAYDPADPPPDDAWLRDLVRRTARNFARGTTPSRREASA